MTRTHDAVLDLLLEHYPALLSIEEIIRVVTAASESFAERDDVEVAVSELVEAGLVHRLGSFAFASLAATTFDRLRAG